MRLSPTEKERKYAVVRVQIEYGFGCFQVRFGLVVSTVWIGSEYGFVTLVDESASESHTQNSTSRSRKRCRQTGSRQSTPLSTIRTRYANSVSTLVFAIRTGKNKRNSLQKASRYGISVSTPHRRYGHRLRTPFLRTPFPGLLVLGQRPKSAPASAFGVLFGDSQKVPQRVPHLPGVFPVGPARQIDVAGQQLPRDNFCLSLVSQLPSPRG